ncbi:MAG TPA: hypothetical protein VEW48_02765 [Thermoanaerobaculia bacterium]|nr:hypothetical protein [Thermoanaerobaculia bacterium]
MKTDSRCLRPDGDRRRKQAGQVLLWIENGRVMSFLEECARSVAESQGKIWPQVLEGAAGQELLKKASPVW